MMLSLEMTQQNNQIQAFILFWMASLSVSIHSRDPTKQLERGIS